MADERWRRLCFRCMAELRAPDGICPACGWDNARRSNGPGDLGACVLKGQYLVGRALGRGGFGITYLGYDLNLNCRVAIKEYFPAALAMRKVDGATLVPYMDARERFDWGRRRALEEGGTTARLSRGGVPNAVQVYNAFEENGTAYIVMEYIEGTTLSKLVKDEGRMSWARAYGLIEPIMRALEAIHARGVIHRDVSPENIMLRANSAETVLLDFGAARSFADEKDGMTETLHPGYAPMEQYSSTSRQDGRTDEYALCATLYYLLTGNVPPTSDQIAIGATKLTAPRKLGADMPEAAEAALLKGMSTKMEDRYPSVAALRGAFDRAGARNAKRPGKLALRIALILALLAAVASAAYLLGRGAHDSTVTPTQAPTEEPTQAPTEAPTETPTEEPTQAPTEEPTETPTEAPTQAPTEAPTQAPTEEPTQAPTEAPTQAPTQEPTQVPTETPTEAPTEAPTQAPTEAPTGGAESDIQTSKFGEGFALAPTATSEAPLVQIPSFQLTFRRGDQGLLVKGLQYHLIEQNYLYDVADGSFGGKTEEAVKQLQADAGLPATGIVDDAFNGIWRSMKRAFVPQAKDQLMMILASQSAEDNLIHVAFKNMGSSTATGGAFNVLLSDADYTRTGHPVDPTWIARLECGDAFRVAPGEIREITFDCHDLYPFEAGDYVCLQFIEYATEDGATHEASQEELYTRVQ